MIIGTTVLAFGDLGTGSVIEEAAEILDLLTGTIIVLAMSSSCCAARSASRARGHPRAPGCVAVVGIPALPEL